MPNRCIGVALLLSIMIPIDGKITNFSLCSYYKSVYVALLMYRSTAVKYSSTNL